MERICGWGLCSAILLGLLLAIGPGVAAVAGAAGTAAGAQPGVLSLRTGDVAVAGQPNLLTAVPRAGFASAERYIVQLDGPLTPERRAALTAAGARLGDYLPTNTFIADLSQTSAAALSQLDFVTWVGAYQPEWRIDPKVGQTVLESPERLAVAARGDLAVTVYLFDGELLDAALTAISQIDGAEVVVVDFIGTQPLLNVYIPASNVQALAAIPSIQYVEEYPEITYRNTSDRWIVQSNIVNVTPLYDNGLHGEGQVLGHMDGQVAVGHCAFYDPNNVIGPLHRKILAYNETQGYNAHGTHTAGTAVGDNGVFDETRGVAYLGKMVHNGTPTIGSETQMYSRLDLHRTQGATVHTNSWGDDSTTAYDGWSRAIDNFSWLYDDNLVCFSVSNGSAVTNPENAKDCLAVGATYDTPNQSSRCYGGTGPTADGRRKPEIYAPGCSIYSAYGQTGCSTNTMSGTSMACPAISATGMLVRQYFTAGYYPTGTATPADSFTPSGALIKAALLNSAVDMTGVTGYPSNLEGWGRVLADNVLYFPGNTRTLIVYDFRNNATGALSTGGSVSYSFTVTGATEQLRVTLVWHDAPAAVSASLTPVNNLNLVVTSPVSATYLGNVFSGGVSVTGGTADSLNNVEQVHLTSPAPGTWTATVNAPAVNTGSQGYALVITGSVSEVVCPTITTHPESQSVCAGDSVTLTAAASGTPPPTYQWRLNTVDIDGATGDSYTIDPVDPNDVGSYDCVATNTCGSAPSNAAILTVEIAPAISVPPATHTAVAGQATSFTVTASGTPAPTYQWRRNGLDLADGDNISGETTETLSLDPVAKTDAGVYDVVVTNACDTVTSTAATLWLAGDMNCDGVISYADINPFVLALSDEASYQTQYRGCFWLNADVNGDGVVSFADINPFVALVGS